MTDAQRMAANKIVNIGLMLQMVEARCTEIATQIDNHPALASLGLIGELSHIEQVLEELVGIRG